MDWVGGKEKYDSLVISQSERRRLGGDLRPAGSWNADQPDFASPSFCLLRRKAGAPRSADSLPAEALHALTGCRWGLAGPLVQTAWATLLRIAGLGSRSNKRDLARFCPVKLIGRRA